MRNVSTTAAKTVAIPLTGKHGKGKVLLIDEADVPLLQGKSVICRRGGYPRIRIYNGKNSNGHSKHRDCPVHRLVLGLSKGDRIEVDHKDRNKLNATRSNLRVATRSLNSANSDKTSSTTFRGVSWRKRNKKWVARIAPNYKQIYLGIFASEIAAAKAYDAAARQYFGEFAVLNFP